MAYHLLCCKPHSCDRWTWIVESEMRMDDPPVRAESRYSGAQMPAAQQRQGVPDVCVGPAVVNPHARYLRGDTVPPENVIAPQCRKIRPSPDGERHPAEGTWVEVDGGEPLLAEIEQFELEYATPADQVQQLLDLIGWCGIFELELLDLGEERFAAIDLNPRPFGWMSLPIGAGANLPALWCDHVLRRHSVSAQVARVGIHYRWADADIRNALTLLRRGHLRSTVAALRPHRRVVHPHFRLDDPGPAVARMGFAAEKMISQRRSILGGARIRARGSNQSAHDPQKPCKDA